MFTRPVVTVENEPWQPPAALAGAKGTFAGVFDGNTGELSWRITYERMGSPALVLADVHLGPSGRFGPIIVRLCGPCTSGQEGVVRVERFVSDLINGNSWVTVKTGDYPNGVIRGQITVR